MSAVHLIDTSVWVEFLRGTGSPAALELRDLLRTEIDAVAITEPVTMELLAGTTTPAATAKVERLTGGIRPLPIDPTVDFHHAAAVHRTARAAGTPIRSIIDCLIAVVAMRSGATVLHRDRDFEHLAAVLPDLAARSLR